MPSYERSVSIEDEDDELTNEIVEQVNEWSSNSNECVTIRLLREDGSVTSEFQPEFTYPMFGEEEAIFGYRDLEITLSFAAHDLQPKLDIEYGTAFEAQGDVKPTDIKEAFRDFLPASAFSERTEESTSSTFKPPGKRIHSYTRDEDEYEIWCASLSDSAAKTLLTNMQVLVPMFIEGGSTLELEQDWTTARWKLFLIYQVDQSTSSSNSPYTLIGFGTSYRVFSFPDRDDLAHGKDDYITSTPNTLETLLSSTSGAVTTTPLDLPSRERLSQFLILPPNQGAGHGHELYNTMYTHLTQPSNIREFTVEDPNESFDDLRDCCDLLHLRATSPTFSSLRINPDIPSTSLTATTPVPTNLIVPLLPRQQSQSASKIMPRQFDRLVEMHTLSHIPARHRSRHRLTKKEKASDAMDRAYYLWRLYVKERLYVFNRDSLVQLDAGERVEKLEAALDSVLEAYTGMIEKVERIERERGSGSGGKRKRMVVVEEDEEDGEEEVVVENGHKKAKQ